MGLLSSKATQPFLTDGQKENMSSDKMFIQDDHVPFMARGVNILHLIPSPFPDVWHKIEDDGAHLDLSVCDDWAKIVTAFTAEWMDLEGHLPRLPAVQAERERDEKKAKRVSKTEL
jgi:glutaminyl-peptide cyclotransferase